MKKLKAFLILLGFMLFLISCEKAWYNPNNNYDFYNTNYRTGLWINASLGDTLEFVNGTSLIRKGNLYKHENYLYKIENHTLFIQSPGSSTMATEHHILKAQGDSVVLGNMFITIEFTNNSEKFIKQNPISK